MREKTSLPQAARFIHTLTSLPVTVVSSGAPYAFYCRDGFRMFMDAHYTWYIEQGAFDGPWGFYEPQYIENELQEGFLEFGLKGGDRLLLGPFLLNCSRGRYRKEALRKLNFDLTHPRIGKEYMDQLVSVDTEAIKAIQFLLFLTQRDLSAEEAGETHTESLVADYYRNLISNRELAYHHPPFQLEQELMGHIRHNHAGNARDTANRLYTHPDASLAASSVRSYRNSLICRCTLYTRAAIEGGAEVEEAFTLSDVMINEIEQKSSIQELYRLDLAMIEGFCQLPRKDSDSECSIVVKRAVAHIRENIYEKLGTADIAERLFVHPNYLSRRFREEMHETISNYILRLKIDESVKLLAYSDNSLSDIAAFLGFSSQSHFGSVFKRQMGMTPMKFRGM